MTQDTTETVEILWTLAEAGREMLRLFGEGQRARAMSVGMDMRTLLEQLQGDVREDDEDKVNATLWKMLGNALYSLGRILKHCITDVDFAKKKTEFELISLLRATHIYAHYHFDVEPLGRDAAYQWIEDEGFELTKNYYYEEGKKKGKWKYDLSISVTGYNKLEYTKRCVESLMKNLPKGITYEIILYNHGSSDGTKEFFESVKPDKQIDILYNGYAGVTNSLIQEGEYSLGISNDVLITPRSIDLMFEAMKNNPTIGHLVPMTGGVSNLQQPEANGHHFSYHTSDELSSVAASYNSDDMSFAETRFRLVNPLSIVRREVTHRLILHGLIWRAFAAFPDDRVSMLCRRMGYKNVLLKNVYCHHYGSVTLGSKAIDYASGRKDFLREYGIDPWGRGFCWVPGLFSILKCDKNGAKSVLGIDCGMGSNPLKIQQDLKMNTKEPEAELVCLSRNDRYIVELQGFCDKVYRYDAWSDVFAICESKGTFDYILIEDHIEGHKKMMVRVYDELLSSNGVLVLFVLEKDKIMQKWISKRFKGNFSVSQREELPKDLDEHDRNPRNGRFWIIEKGSEL